MTGRWLFRISCAALVAATCVGGATAQSRFIPAGELADAPAGFVELCTRQPEDCAPMPADFSSARSDPALITASTTEPAPPASKSAAPWPAFWPRPAARPVAVESPVRVEGPVRVDILGRVNRQVNRSVRQISDFARFGVEERWERPSAEDMTGDCEDVALEKRHQLIAQGFPSDRLFLAVVYRRGVGLHTVLIARTERGDLVLDGLTSRIRPWNRTGYVWLRIQTPGSPMEWRRAA